MTRKYPLRGYFLGVLTHTTAWDRLWGGDVFLRLYIRSSASPRVAAVGLGCWNCAHVVLMVAIWLNIRIYDHDKTWKCDGMQEALRGLALPFPALQWQQHDKMYFWHPLRQLCFQNFLFQCLFFVTERNVTWRDRQTDGQTDRLISENLILDTYT